MRVIIAGSRNIEDFNLVLKAVKESKFDITEVVCGKASGVDTLGERWGKENSKTVKYFPADWKTYGKKAGYLRNVDMAKYAEAAIIVWDGKSPGSKMMADICKIKNFPTIFFRCKRMIQEPNPEQVKKYLAHVSDMESYLSSVAKWWKGYPEEYMTKQFADVRAVASWLKEKAKTNTRKVLIMTVGLPRSGKSSWTKEVTDNNPEIKSVNPDEIRKQLGCYPFVPEREPEVWAETHRQIEELLKTHDKVILDSTNLTKSKRAEWEYLGVDIVGFNFTTSVDECIKRAIATNQEYLVPVIRKMAEDGIEWSTQVGLTFEFDKL